MNDPPTEPLSQAGQARREAMLDELVAVVSQTHRARRLRSRLMSVLFSVAMEPCSRRD